MTALLASACATWGLFWHSPGKPIPFQSASGEKIELYGRGLYRYDWAFKVPIQQGTDAVILLIGVPLLLALLLLAQRGSLRARLLLVGTLAVFFYNASSTVFGIAFNPLFPVYVGYFSAALFALILAFRELDFQEMSKQFSSAIPLRGTAIFLVIAALSTSVWLFEIVPALLSGKAPATLGSYTTEVTAVLDWGIVAPLFLWIAISLLRRRPFAIVVAPILTFFMVMVGVVVLGQRLMQAAQEETVTLVETGVYVLPFILLSGIGTVFLVKYLRELHPKQI
ncbi:MAG: hypothetical protein NZ840_13515 [Anaerolineales bacterium]|nr:hypothetical protein [Anaerolineales bacterium]MDW8163053.1 hypothetical protein [Anaerolineales bacterium]